MELGKVATMRRRRYGRCLHDAVNRRPEIIAGECAPAGQHFV